MSRVSLASRVPPTISGAAIIASRIARQWRDQRRLRGVRAACGSASSANARAIEAIGNA